jgi:excisionase family DNA binding protein
MTTTVTTVQATADERDLVERAGQVARQPGVRLASGAGDAALPPSLAHVVTAAGAALAGGGPVAVVGTDAEVSPAGAAALLGVTRQYVDRLIATGVLPARRLPGSRYRRIPVHAVLARRTGRSADGQPAPAPATDADDDADADLPTGAPPRGTATTARGRERRERLIAATSRLVAERGFHSVGIVDIGRAAGVSGAAIYRHFPNKTQMLVAVFDQVVDELLDGSAQIVASDRAPAAMLEALVRHHVRLVLRNPAVFGVYSQESHNLPTEDRTRLRRNQRTYVLRWSAALRDLRPELDDDDIRTRVQVTFGLLNSLADFPSPLPADQLGRLLRSMAMASLTAIDAPPSSP